MTSIKPNCTHGALPLHHQITRSLTARWVQQLGYGGHFSTRSRRYNRGITVGGQWRVRRNTAVHLATDRALVSRAATPTSLARESIRDRRRDVLRDGQEGGADCGSKGFVCGDDLTVGGPCRTPFGDMSTPQKRQSTRHDT